MQVVSLGLMEEKIIQLGIKRKLPPELMPLREEILRDLSDALLVHKERGVLERENYELTLDLAEGV